ncbi:MAG: pyruvate formate lyase 1-activating protein, partial [Cellulosilyticaceae bacterium]
IRYVYVPNLTDNEKDIDDLAQFLTTLSNVQRIDILPFHKMGEFKWEQLGFEYSLLDTEQPTKESVAQAKSIFTKYNLPVFA